MVKPQLLFSMCVCVAVKAKHKQLVLGWGRCHVPVNSASFGSGPWPCLSRSCTVVYRRTCQRLYTEVFGL